MRSDQWIVLAGGLAAIGSIVWYFFLSHREAVVISSGAAGVQETSVTVLGGYSPAEIHVRAGQPVRLVFDRQEANPCSDELVIPDFQIRQFLPAHQRTAIEFTPPRPGRYAFHCGMGMLRGAVIAE
jgi:plastocyanin domain-containing protein